MIKEYLYTTYSMIVAMTASFSTMKPIKTTCIYSNLQSVYVVEGKYIDSLKLRNINIDTTNCLEIINNPNDIRYRKIFLLDTDIIK